MSNFMSFLLSSAIAVTAVADPQFAEEVPKGAGSSVVFELALAESGQVAKCTFSGMYELTVEAKPIAAVPNPTYISDACRKLSTLPWHAHKSDSGKGQSTFYFCRHLSTSPDYAFCERKFGV